jgi:DHA1 family tetracycline resistance protein-like MFS transporter
MLNPFSSFPILRRFAFLAAATLFFCIPAEGILQTLFVYNEDQFHPTPQMNSIVLASFGMGSVVMLLLIHPLKKVFDDRQLCIIGFAIQAVFCALLGVAWNIYIVLGATIFIGCASIAFPAISAIKANGVSASEQGQVQGALYGLRMIGTGVGPYIFAYTYSAFRDPQGSFPAVPGMPFYIGGGIGLIAVVCGYFVPKKLPSPADYTTPITVDNNEFGAKLLDESFDSLSISSSYKDDIVLSNRTFPQLDSDDEYYPPAVMSLTSGPSVSGAAII